MQVERRVFGCVGSKWPPRRIAITLLRNPYFDHLIMTLIAINTLLAIFWPSASPYDERKLIELHSSDRGTACGTPDAHYAPSYWDALRYIDNSTSIFGWVEFSFLVVFTLEMAVKLLAQGLISERGSYLRDLWNWIDLTVIVTGYFDTFGVMVGVSILRLFRILKPLRAINRSHSMRVLVRSIFQAVPQLCRVLVVLIFLILLFGIIGINLFQGRLRHSCFYEVTPGVWESTGAVCDPQCPWDIESQQLRPGELCASLGNATRGEGWTDGRCWTCEPGQQCRCGESGAVDASCTITDNPQFGVNNFDNILWASTSIFESMTLEGWVNIMYYLQDGGSSLQIPGVGIIFQMSIVLFGSLIAMNLFLSVIADTFDDAEEAEGALDAQDILSLDEDGEAIGPIDVGDTGRAALEHVASTVRHEHGFREACRQLCLSRVTEYFILGCILLNLVTLLMDFSPRTPHILGGDAATNYLWPEYFWTLFAINALLTLIFLLEVTIKLIGLGWRIFAIDRFNLFDLAIVVASTAEVILDTLKLCGVIDTVNLPLLSPLRALRLLRVLKMLRSIGTLNSVIQTLAHSFISVSSLMMLLGLSVVIFALLGMQLFSGLFPSPWFDLNYTSVNYPCVFAASRTTWADTDDYPRNNFDTFASAVVSIFVVLSGENWNDIFHSMHRATNADGVALAYFVILFFVGNLLLFNLFIAILLAHLETSAFGDGGEHEMPPSRPQTQEGGENAATDASSERPSGTFCVSCFRSRSKPPAPPTVMADDLKTKFSFGSYVAVGQPEQDTTQWSKRRSARASFSGPDADSVRASQSAPQAAMELPTLASSNGDRSLLLFGWDSPIRRGCARIVMSRTFNAGILSLIVLSTILLGLDWPGWPPNSPVHITLTCFDFFFTSAFTMEMMLKIITHSFVFSRDARNPAYLSDPWNRLDFFIVVISVVTLIGDNVNMEAASTLQVFRALRAFRALRPLRLVSRWEGMRQVVDTLLLALPSVSTFGAVLVFAMLIFGSIFVQLFGGRLGYCLDPRYPSDIRLGSSRITPGIPKAIAEDTDYDECMALPRYNLTRYDTAGELLTAKPDWDPVYREYTEFPQWTHTNFGTFDNIGYALLLLFEVATLEGWPDVMYTVMDVDYNQKYVTPTWIPSEDGHVHVLVPVVPAVLFILWVVFGSFVLLNMVVGVVLNSFNKMKEQNEGISMMTEEQGDWVRTQRKILETRPRLAPTEPHQLWRAPFFTLATSAAFEFFIMCIISLNMVFLCTEVWNPIPSSDAALELFRVGYVANLVFYGIYVFEAIIKLVGLGPWQYFSRGWNCFDCLLVVLATVDLTIASILDTGVSTVFPPSLLRVIRLLRVMRLLRILRTAKQLRQIVMTMIKSFHALKNISFLLALLMYIYAVFGTAFFWGQGYTPGNFGSTTCSANAPAGSPYACTSSYANAGEVLPQNLNCSYYQRAVLGQACEAEEIPYYYAAEASNWGDHLTRHANFEDVWKSLGTLFRCATGESYNGIMHDLFTSDWGDNVLRCCPTCGPVVGDAAPMSSCADYTAAVPLIFFISFYILLGYVVLNGLFIGVIIDNFNTIGSDNRIVTLRDLDSFCDAWVQFDPKRTLLIPAHAIVPLLRDLPPPLGVGSTRPEELLVVLRELNLPDYMGRVHFFDLLTALAHRIHCRMRSKSMLEELTRLGITEPSVHAKHSINAIELPYNETVRKMHRALVKLKSRQIVAGDVSHSILKTILVTRLQSRWRGYHRRQELLRFAERRQCAALLPGGDAARISVSSEAPLLAAGGDGDEVKV